MASSEEAQFGTLIAAKGFPFSASFMSSSPRPSCYPNFDQPLAAVSYRTGVGLETNGFPMVFLKFRRNRGQSGIF